MPRSGDGRGRHGGRVPGAVDNVRRGVVGHVTTAWLIGIARHKLIDHWRRMEREQRRLEAVVADPTIASGVGFDDWDVQLAC